MWRAPGGGVSTPYEPADCPACGSGESRPVADRDAIARQVESLWRFHLRRLRPDTPLHRLTDRLVFSQRPPVRVVACAACGTVYRDPRERERTLLELYAGETPEPGTLGALFDAQLGFYRTRARRLTRIAGRAGKGVEVGSYVGAFLAAAREQGWDFQGLDVNPVTNAFARQRGFEVATGTPAALDEVEEAPATLDAVALWNCFDQLPDPRGVLRMIARRLRPRGVVAIRVPNGALYRALLAADGTPGAGAAWVLALNNLLGFPYRHGFTPSSLALLLEDAGLDVRRMRGDTLVPIADGFTRRWAAWEERAGKAMLRAALPRRIMPWFEVYAVRR